MYNHNQVHEHKCKWQNAIQKLCMNSVLHARIKKPTIEGKNRQTNADHHWSNAKLFQELTRRPKKHQCYSKHANNHSHQRQATPTTHQIITKLPSDSKTPLPWTEGLTKQRCIKRQTNELQVTPKIVVQKKKPSGRGALNSSHAASE